MQATPRTRKLRRAGGGFTVIEVIVCLGVLMILLSLVMPTLGRSLEKARRVERVGLLRQHAQATKLYANDYLGVFPFAKEGHAISAAFLWYEPLMKRQYLPGLARDVDPYGMRHHRQITLAASVAMVYAPGLMAPGATVPVEAMKASPIRMSDVLYPSEKGMLFRFKVNDERRGTVMWCCGIGPGTPGEIAMGDTSVVFERWTSFLTADMPDQLENGIGQPVVATWHGVKGRDSLRRSR